MLLQVRHDGIIPWVVASSIVAVVGTDRIAAIGTTDDATAEGGLTPAATRRRALVLAHDGPCEPLQPVLQRRLVLVRVQRRGRSVQPFLQFPRLARQLAQPHVRRLRPLAGPQELCAA